MDLATGTGLPSQDLCPRCGEAGALRHLLVQARTKYPNRVWTVASSEVVEDGAGHAPPAPRARPARRLK